MNTNIPLAKNRRWIAALEKGIDNIDQDLKINIMKQAGKSCASDLISVCEKHLKRSIYNIEDLVNSWNFLRESRNLKGRWKISGDAIWGVFGECGCPLIQSGLVELQSIQCYCSQGMMETIFSEVASKPVDVEIKKSIGRGDDVCEFIVRI